MARSNYPQQAKNLPAAVINLGWTIEGRTEEHLPEQLLAGLTLIRIDPARSSSSSSIDSVLAMNEVESGVDCFRIKPEEWLARGMHMK
jgi:hypothetical protein